MAQTRPIVALDLDGSVVFSHRAVAAANSTEDFVQIETLREGGAYCGSLVPETLARLALLAEVVPVTTRTAAQYERLRLFPKTPQWALCANGATLLVEGQPDVAWSEWSAGLVRDTGLDPAGACAIFDGVPGVLRTQDADGFFAYAVTDLTRLDPASLDEVAVAFGMHGWYLERSGRKLYALPALLRKGNALRRLAERLGRPPIVAVGDSALDVCMLQAADHALCPAHAADEALAVAHARSTASGPHAGAELLDLVEEWLTTRSNARTTAVEETT